MKDHLSFGFLRIVAAVLGVLAGSICPCEAKAQTLTVTPVKIVLPPGVMATSLTMTNQGSQVLSFQVRAFIWTQSGTGKDELSPTNDLVASPPLGTIPAGGQQIVRLVLRQPPQDKEASYRILLDEIPPPAAPDTVNIQFRFSIPIFVEPPIHVFPQIQWSVESGGGKAFLEAVNSGGQHAVVSGISLTTAQGVALKVQDQGLPYILSGATRRWRIGALAALAPGTTLHLLTHTGISGTTDQIVPVNSVP